MKLYNLTLNVAVSDELDFVADPDFSVEDLKAEILAKSILWFQKATDVKDLEGYVAMDCSFDEKGVLRA